MDRTMKNTCFKIFRWCHPYPFFILNHGTDHTFIVYMCLFLSFCLSHTHTHTHIPKKITEYDFVYLWIPTSQYKAGTGQLFLWMENCSHILSAVVQDTGRGQHRAVHVFIVSSVKYGLVSSILRYAIPSEKDSGRPRQPSLGCFHMTLLT